MKFWKDKINHNESSALSATFLDFQMNFFATSAVFKVDVQKGKFDWRKTKKKIFYKILYKFLF